MRQVRVTWSRTEHFEAVLEIEDHQAADPDSAFTADDQDLTDREVPNAVDVTGTMTYVSTDREVENVELIDAEDTEPVVTYGAGR
jgi:hypothetical protein